MVFVTFKRSGGYSCLCPAMMEFSDLLFELDLIDFPLVMDDTRSQTTELGLD